MGKLPENYFGPKQRITALKADYPKEKSAILTDVETLVVGDALCILIKASIILGDVCIATGHAFTDCPEDKKAVEKAETIAIGRALVNAGYPESEDLPEDEDDTEEPKKQSKGFLGSKTKKKEEKQDDETTDEDDSEDSEEEPVSKAKPKGLLSSKSHRGIGTSSAARSASVADDDEDDSEEASEDEEETTDDDPTQEEVSEKEEAPKSKKMTREELLAKYRK